MSTGELKRAAYPVMRNRRPSSKDSINISAPRSSEESPSDPANVAVVEDDDRVRAALAFQLRAAGFQVACFSSAQELLVRPPDLFACIVTDIYLPGMDGLELQARIRESSDAAIVFVTGRGNLAVGVQAMKAGAVDVLEKPVDDDTLVGAVKRGLALHSEHALRNRRRNRFKKQYESLPPRQREVFSLLTEGFSNKEVGARLGISERTVKVHRERMRRNMGIDSLAELSRVAEMLRISSTHHGQAGGPSRGA